MFPHPLLQIPAHFTNVHLATVITGHLVDDAFPLVLIIRCPHRHQRLSQLVSGLENGLYTKLSTSSIFSLTPWMKGRHNSLGPSVYSVSSVSASIVLDVGVFESTRLTSVFSSHWSGTLRIDASVPLVAWIAIRYMLLYTRDLAPFCSCVLFIH